MSSVNKMNVGGVDYDICKDEIDQINSDLTELNEVIITGEVVNWPTTSISKSYDISNYDKIHVIILYAPASPSDTTLSIDLGTWNKKIMQIDSSIMRNLRGGFYYSPTNFVGVAAQLSTNRIEAAIVAVGSEINIANWGVYVLGTKK